jgi:hypothetical protein
MESAAASAPCLPERKTGFVELFAIIAMRNVSPDPPAAALPESPFDESFFAQAANSAAIPRSAADFIRIEMSLRMKAGD